MNAQQELRQETPSPAPVKKAPAKQAGWQFFLTVGLKLLLICAVVAAIVSLVNALTAAKAEENLKEEKRKAIIAIFGRDDLRYEKADGTDVYLVYDGANALLGYSVESVSGGFGGDMTLMVGYDGARTILGVSIVSHSETPGLGARVKTEAGYLDQYVGKSGEVVLNKNGVADGENDVDAISGATISSRAVLTGVNRATDALNAYLDSAKEG